MLKRENRLRKNKEFSFVYKKGKSYYSKFLGLYVCFTRNKKSKLGFSISNKVGNSVVRHKIKRKLTEILRKKLATMPVKNYVFVAKIGCDKLTFDELNLQVSGLIERVKNEK